MKTMKKAGFLVVSLLLLQTTQAQTLKDALKLTENHQFELASGMFHQLIAKTPTDAHLYYYMGENMYKSERFDSAAFYYDKGTTVDAAVGLNYVGKGKIALGKNDEATAKPLFEKALFHHTHDAKALIAIAEAYIDNEWKNMAYAIECLEKAEKMDRNNINIYLLLGDAALLGTNDGITALNNYEKARDMDPKNPKPLIHIGTLYERARSYDLSFAEYNKAVSLDVNFAPSYLKLGDLWFQYGVYDSALVNLDKYVNLSKSLSAEIKREKYRFLTKDYVGAARGIESIIARGVNINVLYRLLAYAYYETKKYPEALLNIEKFMKDAPISGDKIISDDHKYYGRILLANAKDSAGATGAIPYLRTAIEMDSVKHVGEFGALYDAYMKTKRFDDAVNTLNRKFKVVKEPSANDIFRVGMAYYQKAIYVKDSTIYLKADSAFAIASEKQPENVAYHYMRAASQAGLDPKTELGLAKIHYERFIALASLDVEKNKKNLITAYYYMTYYYTLQKDKVKATENMNKVLELDPQNKDIVTLKKFIDKLQ